MYQVSQCTELDLIPLEFVMFRLGDKDFVLPHDLYIYNFVAFFTF